MPKDPPIGRWGFVVENALGDGRSVSGHAREIRCNGCRSWFDAHHHRCPDCDHPRPGFNKWLRTAQLDRHLLGYAHNAKKEPARAPITSDVSFPA